MTTVLLILAGLLGLLLLLLLVAVVHTLLTPSAVSSYRAEEPEEESLRLAHKLSAMVRCDTTSHAGVDESD